MIINFDGANGSGKTTISKLLAKELNASWIQFPRYDNQLISSYLNGKFSANPKDLNPYGISTFFAIDRFLYNLENPNWSKDELIITDRYVTSNMIFQACKLPIHKRKSFVEWIIDFEYNRLNLPRPDITIFLNMAPEISKQLIISRGEKQDIHEQNDTYLEDCYYHALDLSRRLNWLVVNCIDKKTNALKSPAQILAEIKDNLCIN